MTPRMRVVLIVAIAVVLLGVGIMTSLPSRPHTPQEPLAEPEKKDEAVAPSRTPVGRDVLEARSRADKARDLALAVQAERRASEAFWKATHACDRAEAELAKGNQAEAKKLWESAERDFASVRAVAEGIGLVSDARAVYETELAKHHEWKLAKYGGDAWKGVTDLVDKAGVAEKAGGWSDAAKCYKSAAGLLAAAEAVAESKSYAAAEAECNKSDLEAFGGASWAALASALKSAREAESRGDAAATVSGYAEAHRLLSQVVQRAGEVRALKDLQNKGKVTQKQFEEGKELLTFFAPGAETGAACIYRSLLDGKLSPECLTDELNVLTFANTEADLVARTLALREQVVDYTARDHEAEGSAALRARILDQRRNILAEAAAKSKEIFAADQALVARGTGTENSYRRKYDQQAGVAREVLFALLAPEVDIDAGGVPLKVVLLLPGKFPMGSAASENGPPSNETPRHEVIIAKLLYMGAFEVTQEQYERVMRANPSRYKGARKPVESVTWYEARKFCATLKPGAGRAARLPTEAEWEYACRAGGSGEYCFGSSGDGLSEYAWFGGEAGTKPVGQKKPNAWGLYDMHGNVAEWCLDWFEEYGYPLASDVGGKATEPVVDPPGPTYGLWRIVRGGCWSSPAKHCRAAARGRLEPNLGVSPKSTESIGFRIVIDLADKLRWPDTTPP